MKRFAIVLLLFAAAALAASGQVAPTDGKSSYNWPAVSGTGQLGSYVDQTALPGIPYGVTIDWTTSGTAPSTCTFRVEGSADGVSWFGLDATSPATDSLPCTSSNMVSITQRPVRKLRIYVVAYSGGDGTTSVLFHYTVAAR